MNYLFWTMIIPLSSALIVLLVSRISGRIRNWFSIAASLATLTSIILLKFNIFGGENIRADVIWSKTLNISLSFNLDGLSYIFAFIASLIGLLTISFSVRDLDGELDLGTYYMWMLLFIGSMIGLALSNDFITFFIFWELISLCSWGLIGFWKDKPKPIRASMKAFLMTHVSSLPLLFAILFLYFATGTFSIPTNANKIAETGAQPFVIGAAIAFLIALLAKSVQVPFHTWLPEAMEAPTPVSALLHAATMVKAGVLLAVRMYSIFSPLFISSYSLSLALSTVGILSMLVAIHMALMEKDVKLILAYSTISHLGYIMLGVGIGTALGIGGGLFHLLNHAVFKACLFLCAGSVIYRVGTRNIEEMGGLAKRMPITATVFLIAALSASGIPPLGGFASKLMIYEATLTAQGPYASVYGVYCFLAIYAGVITLATFMKVTHSVFFGQVPAKFKDVKEPPSSMVFPTILLAILTILFGLLPQLPLSTLVFPALKAIGIKFTEQLSVTWLGYSTTIGSYQAAIIATLLAVSFSLGTLIYLTGIRTVPSIPSTVKYGAMIGGEDAPVISSEDIKISSTPFSQPVKSIFRPIFHLSDIGGFDLFWVNIAKGVVKAAELASKYFKSTLGIPLALIILISYTINLITHSSFSAFLLYTGIILMILGALMALGQSNLIGLLTWASTCWVGRILLELGSKTNTGLAGALFDLLNMVFIISTLVLTGLAVRKSTGTADFKMLGGLARKMPITAGAFLISSLSLAGIPPLNGWWSEYHLFTVANELKRLDLGLAIMLASALTFAFILKAFNKMFCGETTIRTVEARESLTAIPAVILISISVLIGIYPEPLMSWIYTLAKVG